jgi:hypothetical protein
VLTVDPVSVQVFQQKVCLACYPDVSMVCQAYQYPVYCQVFLLMVFLVCFRVLYSVVLTVCLMVVLMVCLTDVSSQAFSLYGNFLPDNGFDLVNDVHLLD